MSNLHGPQRTGPFPIAAVPKPSLVDCTVAMFREADPAPNGEPGGMVIAFYIALKQLCEGQPLAFNSVGISPVAAQIVFDRFAPIVREHHKAQGKPIKLNASVRQFLIPKLAQSFLNDPDVREYADLLSESRSEELLNDERLTHGDGIITSRYAKLPYNQAILRTLEYIEAHEDSGEHVRFLILKQELTAIARLLTVVYGTAEAAYLAGLCGGVGIGSE